LHRNRSKLHRLLKNFPLQEPEKVVLNVLRHDEAGAIGLS